MPVVEEFTITNSNLIEIPYAKIRTAIDVTESNPFPMTIRCPMEWAAIAQCVNQGIDAHLEACNINGVDRYDGTTGGVPSLRVRSACSYVGSVSLSFRTPSNSAAMTFGMLRSLSSHRS